MRLSAQARIIDLGALPFGELGPALALVRPAVLAETAVTFDQLLHVGHARG